MKIEKHSRAGHILDVVSTLFYALAIVLGFVSMTVGLMVLTNAPRETWAQAFLMAAVFAIVTYVVYLHVAGFMESEQGKWSPASLFAMILYSWLPIQAILITQLANPDGVVYRYRLVPLLALAALMSAFLVVFTAEWLYKKIRRPTLS